MSTGAPVGMALINPSLQERNCTTKAARITASAGARPRIWLATSVVDMSDSTANWPVWVWLPIPDSAAVRRILASRAC